MLDLLIKDGIIIDGSGSPWYKGDIGIKEGTIAVTGKLTGARARHTIEAKGLVVTPGFIDSHSHSDLPLLVNGLAESKVRQGVTTEVIGNCGFSPAPIQGSFRQEFARQLKADYNLELNWSSFTEYLGVLKARKTSVNIVPLVGHGALRKSVLGYEDRRPTEDEMEKMKGLLKEAMEAGAYGFSSGLIYPPSCYAEIDELVELAKVAGRMGGIYTTHIRYEGRRLVEGVEEAIRIGERAGIPVQISHHKVTCRENWGLVSGTLSMLKQARQSGVDITCDVYPYLATSTGLTSTLPQWAHEGGIEKLISRIRDPRLRNKILQDLIENQAPRCWHNIVISSVITEKNRSLEGKNVAEIAEEKGKNPEEVVLEIIEEEEGNVGMIRFAMCEEDLETVLKDELSMVGSDGSALADYGLLGKGKPHPRNFGTFPRIIGKYWRERRIFSLERAVYKMTGFPAWRFGLHSKGLIRAGMDADLVIFDPEEIADRATFLEPFKYPAGIKKVIVGGEIIIDDGEHTGKRPGKVLV